MELLRTPRKGCAAVNESRILYFGRTVEQVTGTGSGEADLLRVSPEGGAGPKMNLQEE